MRFGIDAHAIGNRLTGNEVYVRSLLENFALIDKKSDFIAYTSTRGSETLIPSRIQIQKVSNNPLIRLGMDLAWKVRADSPDLLHVQYTGPLYCSVPMVVSIHDVSYLEHPEYFNAARRIQLQLSIKWTAKRAAKILTLSEFSRRGIAKSYGIDADKITVIPAACSEVYKPLQRSSAITYVEKSFRISYPYVLCVGDIQPRKNVLGLIKAFKELITSCEDLPHHLIIVGKGKEYAELVHQSVIQSRLSDRVHFTGYVEDIDLANLYNACDIFVFPSFYEGFGIPILEAMACGRAVACSNTSAIPEVAGAAAMLFDPHSIQSMVTSMQNLLRDDLLRSQYELLGFQNMTRFSWKKTAKRTLDVYYELSMSRARPKGPQP